MARQGYGISGDIRIKHKYRNSRMMITLLLGSSGPLYRCFQMALLAIGAVNSIHDRGVDSAICSLIKIYLP